MPQDERERLRQLIRQHCLSFGDFTLSSGRRSSYYLDLRKLSTLPEGAYLLARVLLADPRLEAIHPGVQRLVLREGLRRDLVGHSAPHPKAKCQTEFRMSNTE